MHCVAMDGTIGVPPTGRLTGGIDNQNIAFPMSDGIALIKAHTGGNKFAIVKGDKSRRAGGIPGGDDGKLVLHGLESHLYAEIGRYTGRQTVSVRLVVHVVLVGVRSLRFPLGVIWNLTVCGESPILILLFGIEDSTSAVVDVGFCGSHPVSGKV